MSNFKEEERSNEAWEPTEDAWKKARPCNRVGTTVLRRPKLLTVMRGGRASWHGRASLGPARRRGFSAFISSSFLFLGGIIRGSPGAIFRVV